MTGSPADDLSRHTLGLSSLLQRAIIIAAALAMLLFALPLAVAVSGLYRSQAMEELARDAERSRSVLSDEVLKDPAKIARLLPAPHDAAVQVGVYDSSGHFVAGHGPAVAEARVTRSARTGVEDQGVESGVLLTVVPLADGASEAKYIVRAAEQYSTVRRSVYLTWGLMAGLAVVILALVAGLARSRARRIARPLQHLADAADALGHGDFSVRAVRGGVAEVDAASASLERTARRLGGMLERERAFSADASHQLRTPLTAVRVGLEAALLTPGADVRLATEEALVDLDRLEQTVMDLLALARDTRTSTEATDVALLTGRAAQQWSKRLPATKRRLDLRLEPDLPPAAVSPPALRTVLDVLIDNAITHGGGTVTVRVRANDQTLVVEVSDEGEGLTGDPRQIFARRSPEARGTGIGLALARSLVEADGGRLDVMSAKPAVFAVLLPVWRADHADDHDDDPADDHDDHADDEREESGPAYVEAGTRPGGS